MKIGHVVEFASEWDSDALDIFRRNFSPVSWSSDDICTIISETSEGVVTESEQAFLRTNPNVKKPDLLIGGPPCQGHSDLNNHTRREDSRNNLYFRMVGAARVLKPEAIIIENVSTVIHSKERVVQKSKEMLKDMGYHVVDQVLWAHHFGIPQKRKRHFLVASRISKPDFSVLDPVRRHFAEGPRDLEWAIGDLRASYDEDDTYNSSATPSQRNQERMDWLIENEKYDLPNHERPPCHQQGHNYPAVYGRMRWEEPTSTLTAGFGSTGQGRFMHPDKCTSLGKGRTLTPHEAARVQTFPDWFDFGNHNRSTMSKTIGNAVPPLLAMHVAYVALGELFRDLL